jgi:chromosome partitioning protein
MMRVWAVANQKGGVGKTTTVVSLGGALSKRGYRTLLLDMDPHGSMTSYFGHDPDGIASSLYQLFQARADKQPLQAQSLIQETRFSNLSLLPASTALATLDRQLGAAEGMGLVINQALTQLQPYYDFVLIDCPPQLGMLMVNALAACEHLIIPVQTEFLALKGLERMERTLSMMQRARQKAMSYTILPTMYDRRTRASVGTLKLLRERYAGHVWQDMIPVDTQFREASRMGVPLSINNPKDRGSLAYNDFLDTLLETKEQVQTDQAV